MYIYIYIYIYIYTQWAKNCLQIPYTMSQWLCVIPTMVLHTTVGALCIEWWYAIIMVYTMIVRVCVLHPHTHTQTQTHTHTHTHTYYTCSPPPPSRHHDRIQTHIFVYVLFACARACASIRVCVSVCTCVYFWVWGVKNLWLPMSLCIVGPHILLYCGFTQWVDGFVNVFVGSMCESRWLWVHTTCLSTCLWVQYVRQKCIWVHTTC